MTGKCAGLLEILLDPISPTISHATAEYTLRQHIVNRMFMYLQVFQSNEKAAFCAAKIFVATGDLSSRGLASTLIGGGVSEKRFLGIQLVEHAREWDRFTDMFKAANPSHSTFDTHSKTGMRHGSKLTKIHVPFEGIFRKVMFM